MPLAHSRALQARVRQWKSSMGTCFPVSDRRYSGDDDVSVQVHFDVTDVDVPRADAVVVAFHLDPDADFAVGVNAGVDVSVGVDAAPLLMLTQLMMLLKTRIVLDAPNRSSQDQNVPKPEF